MKTRNGGPVLLAALLAGAGGTATAQATLRGRVIDSELGQAVAGATVRIKPGPASLTTDTLGRFEARSLAAGAAEVTIEALGYQQAVFTVRLGAADTVNGVFPLDFTGYRLTEVAVTARAELLVPRYLDFERRRNTGQGAYIRWDEIAKKGYGSVGDALHVVRGVRIRCNQETFECFVFMARTPYCQPTWWIDGVQVYSFQENTPIRDIYGIEVYRGPGEVPGEFGGSNAACGVVVIWTKSRPYR
ncbi:MAG TPA: carboxypeptidase-like regulatory domain-containing protein [Gemmatimonadales bacterium]